MSKQQYKHIIYEKQDNISTITMNRPEKRNAFTIAGREQDYADLLAAFDEAAEDDEVKVVILKGAGEAFSVGQDLSQVSSIYQWKDKESDKRRPSQRLRLKVDQQGGESIQKIFLHPKFTVAQVHGYCLHGGMYLALACDMSIVAEDTQMGFREQWWGYAGQVPIIPIVILSVGMRRALDILLTGRTFTGADAAKMGLVTKAVSLAKLEKEVNAMAQLLSRHSADAIAAGKALRHQIYDRLGILSGFISAYPLHTLSTSLRYEPGEFNFFKELRDKGVETAQLELEDLMNI